MYSAKITEVVDPFLCNWMLFSASNLIAVKIVIEIVYPFGLINFYGMPAHT